MPWRPCGGRQCPGDGMMARKEAKPGILSASSRALTPVNAADNETAPRLLKVVPAAARFVLGDTNDQDPALHQDCAAADRFLVATRRGRYLYRFEHHQDLRIGLKAF